MTKFTELELPEFRLVIDYYLGRFGSIISVIGLNVLMISVIIVFYIFMARFLYGFGMSCYEIANKNVSDIVPGTINLFMQ